MSEQSPDLQTSLPMMPFWVGAYLSSTGHFSLAEHGAYLKLLFAQWHTHVLPSDPARLARLIGCSDKEFRLVWRTVKTKFVAVEGGLANKRLEAHRAESVRLKRKHQKGAEITNNRRRNLNGGAQNDAH